MAKPAAKPAAKPGAAPGRARTLAASAAERVADASEVAQATAATIIERAPATVEATRAGALGTNTALQTLPDSTLQALAAGSLGLGVGFFFARAPRLIVLAGLVPAMVIGAAILSRPPQPARRG